MNEYPLWSQRPPTASPGEDDPVARTDSSPVFEEPDTLGQGPVLPAILLGGVGLVLLILDRTALGIVLFFAGILIVVFGARLNTLRRQQVIDRWDTLISGGQGQAEAIVKETIAGLGTMRVPQITLQRAALAPGFWRSLAGDKRPFLVVTHTTNARLKPYKMYVNVRDYGASLQTSWYLAYQPRLGQRIRLATGSLGLDLFDEQDLRAYVTAVHHAFLDAVVELMTTLGKDTSQLNRSSKGFLGIS